MRGHNAKESGEKLPSASDLAKADDMELQEMTENTARSTENLIKQFEEESPENLPMHELQGLDKQLRSIRDSLKVEVEKRFSWKNTSSKKSVSLRKFETSQKTPTCNEKKSRSELPS